MRWRVQLAGLSLLALGLGLVELSDRLTSSILAGGDNTTILLNDLGRKILVIGAAAQVFCLVDAIFLRFLDVKKLWCRSIAASTNEDRPAWIICWAIVFATVVLGFVFA